MENTIEKINQQILELDKQRLSLEYEKIQLAKQGFVSFLKTNCYARPIFSSSGDETTLVYLQAEYATTYVESGMSFREFKSILGETFILSDKIVVSFSRGIEIFFDSGSVEDRVENLFLWLKNNGFDTKTFILDGNLNECIEKESKKTKQLKDIRKIIEEFLSK